MAAEVLRYAAFTLDGRGGNPAGVVLDAGGLSDAEMQAIAAEVGYSETAFVVAKVDDPNVFDVRYFAPQREVPFCGHATIATAVALAERHPARDLMFHTPAGLITVQTEQTDAGLAAELTSVAPHTREPAETLVSAALEALGWSADELDGDYPVLVANAGADHLVLVTKTHERLSDLDYDFDALAALMQANDLITLQLIWPESHRRYHARNPFAGSGVVEDPATGAAAAAFGGYLRELGKIGQNANFEIIQGTELGRPSRIEVSVIEGEPGVRVRGTAAPIEQ